MNPAYMVLLIVFVLILFGMPTWGFLPQSYGYYPSGTLLFIFLVLILLMMLGKI